MKTKTLMIGLTFAFGIGFAGFFYVVNDLPRLDSIEDYRPPLASRVFDSEGHLIAEFFTEKRTLVPVSELPDHVKNVFLAAEDADFYQHKGIDYWGMFRAGLNEIKYKLIGGQRMGGSTITQQTAKTMLLSRQKTYTRKLREFILAKRIEDALSKEEILNLYLNQIYFGNGAYGIEEAARTYYGVGAKELTLGQAAALASAPKSPNRINPKKDPTRVKIRRDWVLDQMLVHGFASERAIRLAKTEPVAATTTPEPYLGRAPYYTEEVRRILLAQFGEETLYHDGLVIYTPINIRLQIAASSALRRGLRHVDKRNGYRGPILRLGSEERKMLLSSLREQKKTLFRSPSLAWDLSHLNPNALKQDFDEAIKTIPVVHLKSGEIIGGLVKQVSVDTKTVTVDLGHIEGKLPFAKMAWASRQAPQNLLKVGDIVLVQIDKAGAQPELSLEQIPLVEGAIAAIEPHTHRVLAMVGGYDFLTSSFNRATQAKRQPGSSFKPFVYATAINKGIVTPATLITDAPKVFVDSENEWKPKNSTQQFLGDITLHSCLIRSVNTCSITILERVGINAVRELAANAGELTDKTPMPRDMTLALGTGEVTLLQHANAYTIFPNGGQYEPPVLIEKVVARDGQILYEAPKVEPREVITPASAYVMTNMMRGLMASSGRRITGLTEPLAGKTGTTNQYRSAWFMGYSQDLVAGVYVGFDDNRSIGNNAYGAVVALPIWGDFMRNALTVIPAREFTQPEGVVWKLIDPKTGLLASKNAVYDPNAASEMNSDESETPVVSTSPIMETFVEGTEPTQNSDDGAPPPLELFDMN